MINRHYKLMYTFYKHGNSVLKLFEWTNQAYGKEYASVLMSGFMKQYSKDKALRDEFDRTCFIGG